MRSADGPQAARVRLEATARWRALGAKWTANLAEMRREGPPVDLVVFHRGHARDLHRTGWTTERDGSFRRSSSAVLVIVIDWSLGYQSGDDRQMHAVGCLGPTTSQRRVQ
jgi:hypothetical protein